jgi:hypothetical protein
MAMALSILLDLKMEWRPPNTNDPAQEYFEGLKWQMRSNNPHEEKIPNIYP